jgi:hypothetical protein
MISKLFVSFFVATLALAASQSPSSCSITPTIISSEMHVIDGNEITYTKTRCDSGIAGIITSRIARRATIDYCGADKPQCFVSSGFVSFLMKFAEMLYMKMELQTLLAPKSSRTHLSCRMIVYFWLTPFPRVLVSLFSLNAIDCEAQTL